MTELTATFEALADENRLAIITLLSDGTEKCVCDVSESLGISNALASHHLKKLREAGLVTTQRKGVWLHCRLDAAALGEVASRLAALASSATAPAAPGCCCAAQDTTTEQETVDV